MIKTLRFTVFYTEDAALTQGSFDSCYFWFKNTFDEAAMLEHMKYEFDIDEESIDSWQVTFEELPAWAVLHPCER